jgi:hypothetical protein
VADWFDTIVTNRGFDLVVGAILATIGGYVATLIQESRHRKAVRQGLGTILHAELISETPRDDPIYRNPDQAMRISLRSVPHLLAPGILDPSRHQHLMMDLIFLASVVDQFNERAMLWDQAFAAGADDAKLQSLYNSLQSSNWDYRDIHANVLVQLWQLGPQCRFLIRTSSQASEISSSDGAPGRCVKLGLTIRTARKPSVMSWRKSSRHPLP